MGAMAQQLELMQAVDLAISGDWHGAHKIVQEYEDDGTACWIHAVLHKIEGNEANSRYWYRRTSRVYEAYADPRAELEAIKAALTRQAGESLRR
jgi:hypothetical protein